MMKGGCRMKTATGALARLRRTSPMRWLALLCAGLLLAGTLPLYAIAFYNHPYYDDFGFSADVRAV